MMSSNPLSPPIFPCPWASEWGEDRYGLWQTLSINQARQMFRWIEPGSFTMGSPQKELEREPLIAGSETRHTVMLNQGFWLADTAVTQALWLAVMEPAKNPSHFDGNLHNPVERVSWNDAQAFIDSLNGKVPGLLARLPTEAQWEYACRAKTDTPFSFGNSIHSEQVNFNGHYPYAGSSKSLFRTKTVPVKSLPANPWGLYEMHGNVWEWCQDVWQTDLGSDAVADPLILQAASDGVNDRVVRGGSWSLNARSVRSAIRSHEAPDVRDLNLGFRLALSWSGAGDGGGEEIG